jgi:hypothetical protein
MSVDQEDVGLVGRVGPVEVDWPRTLGYFGGAAAAVALGVVEASLGIVIAAAPFAPMPDHRRRVARGASSGRCSRDR